MREAASSNANAQFTCVCVCLCVHINACTNSLQDLRHLFMLSASNLLNYYVLKSFKSLKIYGYVHLYRATFFFLLHRIGAPANYFCLFKLIMVTLLWTKCLFLFAFVDNWWKKAHHNDGKSWWKKWLVKDDWMVQRYVNTFVHWKNGCARRTYVPTNLLDGSMMAIIASIGKCYIKSRWDVKFKKID